MCSGLRPLRPAGFIPARPYQSECAAGGRYGALETALVRPVMPPLRAFFYIAVRDSAVLRRSEQRCASFGRHGAVEQ